MRWPFGRKKKDSPTVPLPTVALTDDEHRECQAYLRSAIPQSDQGAWAGPAEVVELYKRSLVADCLMGRARRFAAQQRLVEAFEAATKACCIDPQSLRHYDFGRILDAAGKVAEARTLFAEFLRRDDLEQTLDSGEDPERGARIRIALAQSVAYAKSKTGV
jgi:hypothetical protein